MKGYQNIIGKTQMLQYNDHYNFMRGIKFLLIVVYTLYLFHSKIRFLINAWKNLKIIPNQSHMIKKLMIMHTYLACRILENHLVNLHPNCLPY